MIRISILQSGMVMVPHKLSFKESLHMCSKMSGKMTTYINKTEFSSILHHLGSPANMNAGECSTVLDSDTKEIQVYLGGTDDDVEGVFTTWYTRQLIEYLPWGPNRPYNDGELYNCLMLKASLADTEAVHHEATGDLMVGDESCDTSFCPVCSLPSPVININIRGLCKESLFNTKYTMTINDKGQVVYVGLFSSVLFFNKEQEQWEWYDQKDNSSFAWSKSLSNTMLLGRHVFDFSGVRDDPCSSSSEPSQKAVKITGCRPGQFTCNDGQCVAIENRCDQISNCRSAQH